MKHLTLSLFSMFISLFAYGEIQKGEISHLDQIGRSNTISSHKPYATKPEEKQYNTQDLPSYKAKDGFVWVHFGRKTFLVMPTPDLDLLTNRLTRASKEWQNNQRARFESISYVYNNEYCQTDETDARDDNFEYCQLLEVTLTGYFPVYSQRDDAWIMQQQRRTFNFKTVK